MSVGLLEQLNQALDSWKQPDRKTVVGLEGYSAAGKTTLLEQLTTTNYRDDVVLISLDSFLNPEVLKWLTAGTAEFNLDVRKSNWYEIEPLINLVKKYHNSNDTITETIRSPRSSRTQIEQAFDLSRPVLLLEGTMLQRQPLDQLIDRLIYLDVPADVAFQRRTARIRQKAQQPEKILIEHETWARTFDIIYQEYIRTCQPKERADLVLKSDA